MKILVFDIHGHMTPHLERETEIIQRHLDAGDTVVRVTCKGDLPVCYANPTHSVPKCALCIRRREGAAQLLTQQLRERSIIHLGPQDQERLVAFTYAARTLAELKALSFEQFDIGQAVAAALVDETRDPDLNPTAHAEQVRAWMVVCLSTYLSALNILAEERPQRVYVLNGRLAYYRAILRACQALGIDCYIHEYGGQLDRYTVTVNCLWHEIGPTHRAIEAGWNAADPVERERIGCAFFEDKIKGKDWYPHIADQKHGELPGNWNPAQRNVAVFLSSEFEFAAIGSDWDAKFYLNQYEAIARLVAALEAIDAPVHLYIRVHPNEKGATNASFQSTLALRSAKATVIPPESSVSSYSLLWACEKAVTFGSTMGIEAVYWGKASILAGPAFYGNLGGTHNAASHAELLDHVLALREAKPKAAALKYGHHCLSAGEKYRYYVPEAMRRGTYKGKYVDIKAPRLLRWLLAWFDRPQWRLSGTVARASLSHRRLAYRRLGVAPVDDPVHTLAAGRGDIPKRIAARALAAAFRRLFSSLYRRPTRTETRNAV